MSNQYESLPEREREEALEAKMNAPKVYRGGDMCRACWGRGGTGPLTCQVCDGTGKRW